jgi:hypothetical protein
MRTVPGFSRMPLTLLVTLVVVLALGIGALVASLATSSDDNGTTSGRGNEVNVLGNIKVVIPGTNDAYPEVTDGGITGEGTFKATGAITDQGMSRGYRGLSVLNPKVILLRFLTRGRRGEITYLVRIDTTRRPVISRWTIESGTEAYKGLHGKGTETENARFTVSTLRGTVSR